MSQIRPRIPIILLAGSILFGLSVLSFSACGESNTHVDLGNQSGRVRFLDSLVEPQKFTFREDSVIEIVGKHGTQIIFQVSSFQFENGEPVLGSVEIELREYYDKGEIVAGGMTTQFDSVLLETGGMIKIDVKSNGRNLSLRSNKSYSVSFPVRGIRKDDMKLFLGDTLENGNIVWTKILSDSSNTVRVDSILGEDGVSKVPFYQKDLSMYLFEGVKNLGVLNCDRILEGEDMCNISMTHDGDIIPGALLIFEETNSVAGFNYENEVLNFWNLPKGQKAHLISYYEKDGRTYYYEEFVIVEPDHKIDALFVEIEKEKLRSKIQQMSWFN